MSYPECEYGDVFDEFFGSPTWKYFEADTGEQVVEFTGYCIYQDVEVKARLQFILDMENETFESGAMSFNDVPQLELITTAMIQKAFENYMEENGMEASAGNDLEDELSDVFLSETEANDNISDKSINMDEGGNEDIVENPGTVTVKDIINTQWAMTPNEEYSFLVLGEEGDTEFDTVEVYIIETDNPENVLYHGWSRTITGTEMVDLYITVGFGRSDEFALIWQNYELIDYPRLEALENTTIEFEGDYHYYGS